MTRLVLAFLLFCAACSDRIDAPILPEARGVGATKPVFLATNRVEDPPGTFGFGRSQELGLMQVTVSIPPQRAPGTISDGLANPNPERDFVLVDRRDFAAAPDFQAGLKASFVENRNRDVTVYVHGFNNSFADAAFRIAQLSHDLNLPGSIVSFSWPSRGNPLGYQYDWDSALYSRDALAQLLLTVATSGAEQITLVGHSMGGALTVETLRELELATPGWAARNLDSVLLISPDINVDVFRAQTSVFREWPQPFAIFGSKNDVFLRLSGQLRGEDRQLGKLQDIETLDDLPLTIFDVSDFDENQGGNHFVAGSSRNFISMINAMTELDPDFLTGPSSSSVSLFGTSRVSGRVETIELTSDYR